jgi:hypothetical protein
MTQVGKRHSAGSMPGRMAALIARFQRYLSDRVHASGDALAREDRWAIAATTGRFGFGARSYRDLRFTGRATAGHCSQLASGSAPGRP